MRAYSWKEQKRGGICTRKVIDFTIEVGPLSIVKNDHFYYRKMIGFAIEVFSTSIAKNDHPPP
jgi:hypothetical protein